MADDWRSTKFTSRLCKIFINIFILKKYINIYKFLFINENAANENWKMLKTNENKSFENSSGYVNREVTSCGGKMRSLEIHGPIIMKKL